MYMRVLSIFDLTHRSGGSKLIYSSPKPVLQQAFPKRVLRPLCEQTSHQEAAVSVLG